VATKESTIDKGGFVENVANASLEPEEKKVRGQPFTYAELGGVLAQDVEDRKGFAEGTQPLTFNQQYHLDTIQDGSVLENIDGDPVTVNSIGITHNNKYYNVPSYDRHGGFFRAEEAKNKFLVDIELGFITGYNTSEEADNAAYEEHQMMNNDRDKALEAVGYRDTPWDHFLEGAKAGKKAFGFANGGRVGFENGGSNTVAQWQFALEQQQPTELTPNEIRSEEHFQRIKDEPGLGENAPLIQTAAYTYGLVRPIVGAIKARGQQVLSNQLKKLRGSDLYHGGYGWQSGSKGLWTTPSVKLAQSYRNRRAESLSSRSFEATTPPAVWKAGTDTLEKVVVLDKPTKVFIAEVKNEIKRLESQVAKNPAHETIDLTIEIRALNHYLKHPKKMGNTHNIGYDAHIYDNALRRVLTKNNYDGVVNSKHLKTIVTGGKDNAQFVFLRRPDLNKIPNEQVRKILEQEGMYFGKSEGGLVGEMDRLGFAEGAEVTYGRGSSWLWDSIFYWTPVGSINNVSLIAEKIDQKRFPRMSDWVTRVTNLNKAVQEGFVDPLKEFTSTDWGIAREEARRIEEDKRETDLDESGYGSLLSSNRAARKARRAERRAKRRGARDLTTDAEIAAREARDAQRGTEQAAQLRSGARARGDAMFQREAEALAGTNSGTEGSRGTRRVMFNKGSLVKSIDDLKITYDNFSAEEASELQRLLSGRVGFAEGELVDREKRMQEYKQAQQDLEDFISDNRLVSKEAQMSLLSGEGYRDPRFIHTTGNENLDHHGLHPLSPDGSGQVLYDGQMGLKVSPVEDASVINDIGLGAQTLGTYDPYSDIMKYQTMTSDLGYTVSTPEETQTHEIIHRTTKRSGYREQRVDRLDKRLPKHLKDVAYYSDSLAEEILAHGLQHKLSGGNFEDIELLDKIKFRISKYVTNDKIKKQYMEALPFIVEDFEEYLNELEDN